MYQLLWSSDEHPYESGIDRGVYYGPDGIGQVWNGLASIQDSSDSDGASIYIDGVKIKNNQSSGEFLATVEAYTYPPAFDQRSRARFGMSYRVNTEIAYKIHIVYNAIAAPSARNFVYDETASFSWAISALPVPFPGAKPCAHVVIDGATTYPWTMDVLEAILYGSDDEVARLPSPQELFNIFELNSILIVTDNEDGSCTVAGPDDAIVMLDETNVQIIWPSVIQLDDIHYTIASL